MEAGQHTKKPSTNDLGWLLDAGDDAVVTLIAGDTRLVAHRRVLMDRSPVFGVMFQHDMLEASTGSVSIEDVEGPVLRQLLAYLYTLQVPQLSGVAPQLLAAADKYGVSALKEACEQQVATELSVETAAAAAVLAVRHSCDSLTRAAVSFIKGHLVEVMATEGWADVVRRHPEDVVTLSRLLYDTRERAAVCLCSAPPPGDSGTRPCPSPSATAQPPSDGSQAPSPATAASSRAAPPDGGAVSGLWSLSSEEKGKRLVEAAKQGAVGELEALLAVGADVGARVGKYRRTGLHWAARRGHAEAARRLLAAGAAADARDGGLQWTPLHSAAREGHVDVVRLLLAGNAYHSPRHNRGWTPLHLAAHNGETQAAGALLEAGADRAARNNDGDTPLDIARRRNHRQVADLLQGW